MAKTVHIDLSMEDLDRIISWYELNDLCKNKYDVALAQQLESIYKKHGGT